MDKAIAYVDGSFNKETNEYSYGVVFIYKDKEYYFKEKFSDEFKEHHQIAGELKGAIKSITICIKNKIKELDLYYDYLGIEKWYKEEWKANTKLTKKYQEYVDMTKKDLKINFYKVKSHSNNYYNDLADKLAKEALCLN